MTAPDPFGTADLRAAVLAGWAGSPTRFREDANAEEDLLLGGYADRWLVELAQNAADAARRAGVVGRLLVAVTPDRELRVANTGAPLDAAGVAALASLRASAKRADGSVGRFGVGFAAVLGVSAEPRIVSAGGGVRFSAAGTRAAVAELPGAAPAELARRDGRPPVLRLPWPVPVRSAPGPVETVPSGTVPDETVPDETVPEEALPEEAPPVGYDTEVRLPLLPAVDAAALADAVHADAADLLLALPWLVEIAVREADGETRVHRRRDDPDGTCTLEPAGRRWRLVRRSGVLNSGVGAAEDPLDWSVCWALPVDPSGRPDPLAEDVLHAPTPSDERLGLPARLIAGLPMQPSRRRVRAGAAADEVVRAAASAYLDLVLALPPEQRAVLAPAPDFPRGELDAALRAAVSGVLRDAEWLPAATHGQATGAGPGDGLGDAPEAGPGDGLGDGPDDGPGDGSGRLLAPARARLLEPGSPDLAVLVADAVPELLADAVRTAPRAALAALGVRPLGPAELADRLAGVRRPPPWWRTVYGALDAAVEGAPDAREELAALPVPLADGRTVTGPRGALALDGEPEWTARVTERVAGLDLPGVRIVHPDAAHPLLAGLGVVTAGLAGLLDHPGVVAAVGRSAEADDPDPALARFVLDLVAELNPGHPVTTRPWLAALALPDADGEPRRADELLLPDAALRAVLAPDGPLGVLDAALARGVPRAVLTGVGVLDSFAVLVDDDPGGPDHDLDDEERWWDQLAEPPSPLIAVRDLDLVDDTRWPAALALLAADPQARAALRPLADGTPSYTTWWLARHARLAGRRPGHWRLASATALAGLYDEVPPADQAGAGDEATAPVGPRDEATAPRNGDTGPRDEDTGVPDDVLAAAGVRRDLTVADRADAADLLARLGDPRRRPDAALTLRAHAELAAAVLDGRVDPGELDPPERLRSTAGSVITSDRAVLLDRPWPAPALDPAETVPGTLGDPELTAALAELLDLPPASELVAGQVVGEGRPQAWSACAEVVAACAGLGLDVPAGGFRRHDDLRVELTRPTRTTLSVPCWPDGRGRWHAADPVRALLAVLAGSDGSD